MDCAREWGLNGVGSFFEEEHISIARKKPFWLPTKVGGKGGLSICCYALATSAILSSLPRLPHQIIVATHYSLQYDDAVSTFFLSILSFHPEIDFKTDQSFGFSSCRLPGEVWELDVAVIEFSADVL